MASGESRSCRLEEASHSKHMADSGHAFAIRHRTKQVVPVFQGCLIRLGEAGWRGKRAVTLESGKLGSSLHLKLRKQKENNINTLSAGSLGYT